MEHICQYCKTPFTAKREGKNYCSNSCRQKAFYKRNAAEASSNTAGGGTGVPGITSFTGDEKQAPILPTAEQAATVKLPDKSVEQADPLTGKGEANEKPKTAPGSSISTSTNTNTFQWVSSRFNDRVEQLSEEDNRYSMFLSPQLYLSAGEKEKVVWVSIRLRSLLESLLRLHRGCNTPCSQLIWVRKAFTAMQEAPEFRGLPASYPYTAFIKEMEQGLLKITEGYGKNVPITVKYSRKRKQEMIACRFNLSALVPYLRPGELFPPKQKEPKKVVEQTPVRKYEFAKRPDYLPYRKGSFSTRR
jgi:hypothetical protein